ncbi:head scaffolding protein [Aquamicrobium phage P14]|uniref:Putative scaffold-like protein n=1 Tax=Aquamicrobium phage P14 TaxID=1927013 RepID=A0A1L5C062_9CAUD|nr:head scaffolding protein [Aquamicrobium phage P14]APL99494.1 putative scaffold-like protein [Aquamicrobium phage P14]
MTQESQTPTAPQEPVSAPAAPAIPTAIPATPAVPAVPQAAPVAAPAVPATPAVEPAEDAKEKGKESDGVVTYEATGDSTLDVALAFVGRLGISPESPEMQAATKGDFGLLKAKLAGMGAKAQGWEQYLALGEAAYQKFVQEVGERASKTQEIVLGTVGGEENWKAISAWASETLPQEEKDAINAMFDAGGVQAKAAAALLAQAWGGATNVDREPTPAAKVSTPPVSQGALTPAQYREEVRKLTARGEASQAAIAALEARVRG